MATMLAFLVPILLLGVIWIGIRNGQFTIAGIAAGFAIYVIAIAVSIVASIVMWRLTAMLAGWRMLPIGTTYGGFYFAIAADALIFGALWAAYMVIGRSISEQNLGVGALVVLTVMLVTASIVIPSGAHPCWWLLLAMLAISMSLGVTDERLTTGGAILSFIALAFATIMFAPSLAFERGRNDASPRVRWIGQRLAFRSVHPLHGPPYRRAAMDRARCARIVRDRDDRQRQRGQLIRRVSAAS